MIRDLFNQAELSKTTSHITGWNTLKNTTYSRTTQGQTRYALTEWLTAGTPSGGGLGGTTYQPYHFTGVYNNKTTYWATSVTQGVSVWTSINTSYTTRW